MLSKLNRPLAKASLTWILLLAASFPIPSQAMGSFWKSDQTQSQSSTQPAKENAYQSFRPSNQVYHYCPDFSTLFKKSLVWYAPGGWRGHGASFVDKITGFYGSQWVGVKLGKIICLYQGKQANTFPVSIERDNLVIEPKGGAWGKEQRGYKNCRANDPKDCGFLMASSDQENKKAGNLYQELKFK